MAQQVLEGGRSVCAEAGIPLAGGHSIDSPEPIFGLAVTGRVEVANLKRNDTAEEGCQLLLTKPLGVGILSTAQKQGKLKEEDADIAPKTMMQLNKIGAMCEGSSLSAEIDLPKIPLLPKVQDYLAQGCVPGGTHRNWASYGQKVQLHNEEDKLILCDPQTSGGLMLALAPEAVEEVQSVLAENAMPVEVFGSLLQQGDKLVSVKG